MEAGIKTTGTVVGLQESGKSNSNSVAPVIEFVTASGELKTYSSNFYTNISPFTMGEKAVLWYNPAAPDEVVLEKDGLMEVMVPLLLSLAFGSVVGGVVIWSEWRRRLKKWLLAHGRKVQAAFKGYKHKTENNLFSAQCEWTDPYTKQTYVFKGEWLPDGPNFKLDDPVPVWIVPKNPLLYWVDTSGWV